MLPIFAFGQVEGYAGTYEVVRFANGQPIKNKSLPTNQIMVLELKRDGTLKFGNFINGFTGKWVKKADKLELTFIVSPAGKLTTPEVLSVQPVPDRKRMIVLSPAKYTNNFEFYWNPKVVPFIKSRLEAEKKKKAGGH